MRTMTLLMLITASINLTACSSMTGNVIPDKGPSMEQVYDAMGKNNPNAQTTADDLKKLRNHTVAENNSNTAMLPANVNRDAVTQEFHQLPNPEIQLYVFPHLAGRDQVPIPGYYTAFNAYEHNHYALPQERVRG